MVVDVFNDHLAIISVHVLVHTVVFDVNINDHRVVVRVIILFDSSLQA